MSSANLAIPATPQQEGIWVHALSHSTATWNFSHINCYTGALDTTVFRKAFALVLQRHAAFRTKFRFENGALLQVLCNEVDVNSMLEIEDADAESADVEQTVKERISAMLAYEFDLSKEVPLKLKLVRTGAKLYFILVVNHIIADAASVQVFWTELAVIYNALLSGLPVHIADAPQYIDYAAAQQQFFQSAAGLKQKEYWRNKLAGQLPALKLYFYSDKARAELVIAEKMLSAEEAQKLKNFALQHRIAYSAIHLFAYALLLMKYSGQHNLMIGNMTNGRDLPGKRFTKATGLFASRLVHLFSIDPQSTIIDALRIVHADVAESFANGNIPYEEMVKSTNIRTGQRLAPVFQALFNAFKEPNTEQHFNGLEHVDAPGVSKVLTVDNQYDIQLGVIDVDGNVKLRLAVNCEEKLLELPEIMLDVYISMLRFCINNHDKKIVALHCLTQKEEQLLESFNNTVQPFSQPRLIHEKFRRQAAATPNKQAIIFANSSISYAELDKQTDALAFALRQKGVTRNSIVGLQMSRTPLVLKCILAILKAGGAYLPLDNNYPKPRLLSIVQDAAISLLLTDSDVEMEAPTLLITEDSFEPVTAHLPNISEEEDLAYILYTSGSTGKPKGVMISHRAVDNFSTAMDQITGFAKRVYSLTTPTFDMFVTETIVPLCCGGTVVFAGQEQYDEPQKAANEILEQEVQILQLTPSRVRMLIEGARKSFLYNLSDIITGGEPMPLPLLNELRTRSRARIFNMYGPTETTVFMTAKDQTSDPNISVGKPFINTRVQVIDERLHVQGIGVYGEVCISGDCLFHGYLANKTLTAEKLVEIEFNGRTEKMYRSGDIGRWLPNGELEIMGRTDGQVKVRGYRIELGDIEHHLQTHPQVSSVAVLLKTNGHYHDLHAYYVSQPKLTPRELRTYLAGRLPQFMVPAYFIPIPALPLTANKKLDKNALLQMESPETSIEETVQLDDVEPRLIELWSQHIQSGEAQLIPDFFEAGGHSLKAIALLTTVEKEFRLKISMRDFFQNPTIHFLNEQLAQTTVAH